MSVRFHGVPQFVAALKAIDVALPGQLKQEFLGVAADVASNVSGRIPKLTGKAAGSVKPRATTRGASIAAYGSAAPYGPWLDFGGSVGRGHRPGVAWSGAIKRAWMGKPAGEGRYLYPAIRANRKNIIEGADDAVEKLAKRAGFETRGGV